jgi:hypothetical protein
MLDAQVGGSDEDDFNKFMQTGSHKNPDEFLNNFKGPGGCHD